jgi:hypothetical protein
MIDPTKHTSPSQEAQSKSSITPETRVTVPFNSVREEVLKDIPESIEDKGLKPFVLKHALLGNLSCIQYYYNPVLISKECSTEILQEILQKQNKDVNIREKSNEVFDSILGVEDSYGSLSEEHLTELQALAKDSKAIHILDKIENRLQYFTAQETSS